MFLYFKSLGFFFLQRLFVNFNFDEALFLRNLIFHNHYLYYKKKRIVKKIAVLVKVKKEIFVRY